MEDNKKIMKIVEICSVVNDEGQIVLNRGTVEKMNFNIGQEVWFTYLTESEGIVNESNTFVVTPKKLENMEEVIIEDDFVELEVPIQLLDMAGISNTADLDIVCEDKQIILRESVEIPEQVFEVCEKLGIQREVVEKMLREE